MSEKIGAIADGAAEDLIRAIVQLACAEGHTKTLIDKYSAELENGIVDAEDPVALKAHVEKLNDTVTELEEQANVRRAAMKMLLEMYDGDKDYWCEFKHLGVAAYNLFEVYQATGDATAMNLYLEANKRFVKATTRFLGVEITDCAACLSDQLRAKGGEKNG